MFDAKLQGDVSSFIEKLDPPSDSNLGAVGGDVMYQWSMFVDSSKDLLHVLAALPDRDDCEICHCEKTTVIRHSSRETLCKKIGPF
jgi:hypothetical protein